MENEIKQSIEEELKKRSKSVRNRNAIDKFLECFVPPVAILKDIFTGSKKEIKYEKQNITIDKILDLVISIDNKLSQYNGRDKIVGILNRGKNTSIKDCDFFTDIGVQDEGWNTLIDSCRFFGNIQQQGGRNIVIGKQINYNSSDDSGTPSAFSMVFAEQGGLLYRHHRCLSCGRGFKYIPAPEFFSVLEANIVTCPRCGNVDHVTKGY